MELRKYCSTLWSAGHKTVNFFPDGTATSTPHIMCITGTGVQKYTAKIPTVKGLPKTARQNIEQYLKLSDWTSLLDNKDSQENDQPWATTEIVAWQETRQSEPTPSTDTGKLIQNLIHEPSEDTLLEELEDLKHVLSQDKPLSWLVEILTDELWKGEQFQNGDWDSTAQNAQPA